MKVSLSLLVTGSLLLCHAEQIECQSEECEAIPTIPDGCTLAYAPISESEWGIFSLIDRSKGAPIWGYGDIVIQVPDASPELEQSLRRFAWNGQETGGQYEGQETVHSLVPGLGMMTRVAAQSSNLLPFVPRVDEGGLTRFDSPGAGAISHYHNYTWFVRSPVSAGEELQMERSLRLVEIDSNKDDAELSSRTMMMPASGYCLDNIRPRTSRTKEAGRGAFATRAMPAGTIIAPVPVLPISSSSLDIKKSSGDGDSKTKQQLLRNYCLGNSNSTILLYPFGPMINLINHFNRPNVKFQWSKHSQSHLSKPLNLKDPPFLLMELVATRDISEGEELYLDYGRAWEDAWWQHVQSWKAADMHYSPSYVMDDAIRLLRTQQEQKDHEYPSNVFTSCFYRFSDRETSERALSQSVSADKVTSFRWKLTKGLYDLKNLRPCEVLRRVEDNKGRSAYAVRILNRPGLPEEEIIPKGSLHIVTHIPRQAIRFSDTPGTTDQHLADAFRKEIGLGDDIFPKEWTTDVVNLVLDG